MSYCPTCKLPVEGEAQFCPRDGSPLVFGPVADPLVGRLIGGRYRLVDRLGQGGMGTVYRALHTLMDKPVAVKVLRADMAGDPEAALRFHREARSASRLDHEHCIRVTDFGQSDDGLLYLVMELLEGESLGARIARGPIEPGQAATIARGIAEALVHAHEHGIIHRDLKPDNVFLVRRRDRYQVKVLDFGLAKIAHEGKASRALTRSGAVYGTPDYMAPEQAQGEALDARTDIYAVGVILYQMLVGELPFEAASFLVMLSKHVSEPPRPPRERRPDLDIPAALEAVVLRCLEKAPANRYPTAEALVEALAPLGDASASSLPISVNGRAAAGSGPTNALGVDSTRSTPSPSAPSPGQGPGQGQGQGMVMAPGDSRLEPSAAPRSWRWPVLLGVLALGLAGAGLAIPRLVATSKHPAAPPVAAPAPPPAPAKPAEPTAPAPSPSPPDPLDEARRLLDNDDLEEADRILRRERAARDGVDLQILLAELDQRQGNRLGALAHLYHATRIAPAQPEPHARLAALLALLGQRDAACRTVREALAREPKNSTARSTAAAAGCKENP